MIVAKFGGTSLASAESIARTAAIIRSDSARRCIVLSAPGKRFPSDIKITDLLLTCHRLRQNKQSFKDEFQKIRERYLGIARDLGLPQNGVARELDEVERHIADGESEDYVLSRGEYLSAKMLSGYLGMPFVDAATVVRFRRDGVCDHDATYALIKKIVSPLSSCVLPGYYGADEDGRIRVFSRGGSDVTGALAARGLNADLYENWTDVSGFRSADPRIVPDAAYIRDMTYRELRELSYMGASVLHEDAVFPVRTAGIATHILNTFDPMHPGTAIHYSPMRCGATPRITGIAGRKGFSSILIEKHRMNAEIGFVRKVLQIFEDLRIGFDHMPTGIDDICVILPSDKLEPVQREVAARIEKAVSPDRLIIRGGLAMVAAVGCDAFRQQGMCARLFTALSEQGIRVRTSLMSPSNLSMLIGVDEKDLNAAIRTLYDAFIRT